MENLVNHHIDNHISVFQKLKLDHKNILNISNIIVNSIQKSGKLMLCGNGGSASDAQHIAAEFVGRFVKERNGLPSIALTTDTSIITAVGNDYGFDNIFSRQVEALATKEDVLLVLSTSGNSKNILNGISAAKKIGCETIGLFGGDGGEALDIVDHSILVPSDIVAHIQEAHIAIGHIICTVVDTNFN